MTLDAPYDPITPRAAAAATMGVLGTIGALGLVCGALLLKRRRRGTTVKHNADPEKRAALRDYLRDHLTGSDAAISVVERLKDSHKSTPVGALCAQLYEEFAEERAVVRALLTRLDGSTISLKRIVGQTTGAVLQGLAGGAPGDLALFRTLEGLAVGVQGKRCLWRAAQWFSPELSSPEPHSFRDLELLAVDQWRRIEGCRQALVPLTFAGD